MSIKLVAFDMDYTLLRTGGALSEKTAEVLSEAREKGILLVPATGRDICEMEDLLEVLKPPYLVTVNGAVVRDREKIITKRVPKKEAFLEKLELALSMGLYTEVYCDGVFLERRSYDNMEALGLAKDQLHMFSTTRRVAPDLLEICRNGAPEKLHIVFRDLEDKKARMAPFLGSPDFAYTAAFINNLELSAPGVDKASGLRALAEYLGIRREEVMAIGDGANDASMLSWAGVGVAVANAVPEAKAAADFVSLSNDEDGAAKAIEMFCFSKPGGRG